MLTKLKYVRIGGLTGIITNPAAVDDAELARQALNSPGMRREIEEKAKRFLQDRLVEALRRGSQGSFTIRL